MNGDRNAEGFSLQSSLDDGVRNQFAAVARTAGKLSDTLLDLASRGIDDRIPPEFLVSAREALYTLPRLRRSALTVTHVRSC